MSPFISLPFFYSFVSSHWEQEREVHSPPKVLLNLFVSSIIHLLHLSLSSIHQTDGQTKKTHLSLNFPMPCSWLKYTYNLHSLHSCISLATTVCCHEIKQGSLLSNNFTCSNPGGFLFTSSLSLCLSMGFSMSLALWPACPSGVGQRSAQWTTADLVYFCLPLVLSLSTTQAAPWYNGWPPSVSSHQRDWQLSIKCLGCSLTGGSTDRQPLCLCVCVATMCSAFINIPTNICISIRAQYWSWDLALWKFR